MSKQQQAAARQRAMKLLDAGGVRRGGPGRGYAGAHGAPMGPHWRDYGLKSLWSDARGRAVGNGRTPGKGPEKEMQKLFRDQRPDQRKLPFACWTRCGGRWA